MQSSVTTFSRHWIKKEVIDAEKVQHFFVVTMSGSSFHRDGKAHREAQPGGKLERRIHRSEIRNNVEAKRTEPFHTMA